MRQFGLIFEMQLYIFYFEIIDFDVKQSWTELCWIPPRLVTTWRRHKSELSTSVSYTAATPELMLALIELPLLRDEKIGKIGLLRHINCHLLTQATDLLTETSQQIREECTTGLDTQGFVLL